MLTFEESSTRCFAWSLDLVRAIEDRPAWAKLLIRLALGKYAFREYIGLRNTVALDHYISIGYDLESQDYHKEKTPLRWWRTTLEN